MTERRKEPPRDPGAYIGRQPERWTESVDRNPVRGPGRPGMRRGPAPDRPVRPEAMPDVPATPGAPEAGAPRPEPEPEPRDGGGDAA